MAEEPACGPSRNKKWSNGIMDPDSSNLLAPLAISLILLVLTGCFAAAESAFTGINDNQMQRLAAEGDRRARRVALTDHGRDQAQEARDHQRVFARETLAVLDDAEKRQLAAIVLKLNAALG